MNVGALVWVKNPDFKPTSFNGLFWVPSTVEYKQDIPNSNTYALTVTVNGKKVVIKCDRGNSDNSQIKQRHPLLNAFQEDILDIPYLNEPEVLQFLKSRYEKGYIYTYSGSVLVVFNPFDQVKPDSTGSKLVKEFISEIFMESDSSLIIPSSTNEAGSVAKSNKHTILVSGESGSGKSETCKNLVRALAGSLDDGSIVEATRNTHLLLLHRLQLADGILDSLGNASTLTTRNSSRYGKLIELHFGSKHNLVDCKINTYLLESSRIFTQQKNERNYNVFYELLLGANISEKQHLGHLSISEYHFLNQGGPVTAEEAAIYRRRFSEFKDNCTELGLDEKFFHDLQRILSGILILGQLNFANGADIDTAHLQKTNTPIWEAASRLLGINKNDLIRILTIKTLVTPLKESIQVQLSPQFAEIGRDATVKLLYRALFDKMVKEINIRLADREKNHDENLKTAPVSTPSSVSRKMSGRLTHSVSVEIVNRVACVISIVDIFGFDSFTHNSIDQLCINFANEALQQLFITNMFKLEISLYEKESIQYDKLEFVDNKDNLEFISHGLFKVLDDQCKLPNPTDKRFAAQLYKDYEHHSLFHASGLQQSELKFNVHHYAGPVEYTALGFVNKNLDHVPTELLQVMCVSNNALLADIFPKDKINAVPKETNLAQRRGSVNVGNYGDCNRSFRMGTSLVTQFKVELTLLIKEIESSNSHYVKCIKPYDNKRDLSLVNTESRVGDEGDIAITKALIVFDQFKVSEQLRNGGILEAIRIARSGYRTRINYIDFYNRYRLIAEDIDDNFKGPQHIPQSTGLNTAKTLGHQLIEVLSIRTPKRHSKRLGEMFQRLTSSKSFKKTDSLGDRRLSFATTRSQRTLSMSNIDVHTYSVQDGIVDEQNIQFGKSRIFLKKREYDFLEAFRNRFVTVKVCIIQTIFRRYYWQKQFNTVRFANLFIQRVVRGHRARKIAYFMRSERLIAYTMQRLFRKRKLKQCIISLQATARRFMARKLIMRLRERRKKILAAYGEFMLARDVRMERRRQLAVTRAALFGHGNAGHKGQLFSNPNAPSIANFMHDFNGPSSDSIQALRLVNKVPNVDYVMQQNQYDYALLIQGVHSLVNNSLVKDAAKKRHEENFDVMKQKLSAVLEEIEGIDLHSLLSEFKDDIEGGQNRVGEALKLEQSDAAHIAIDLGALIGGVKATSDGVLRSLKAAEQMLDLQCLTQFSMVSRLFGPSTWNSIVSNNKQIAPVKLVSEHKLFRKIRLISSKLEDLDRILLAGLPRLYLAAEWQRNHKLEVERHREVIRRLNQDAFDYIIDFIMLLAQLQVSVRQLLWYYKHFIASICDQYGESSDFYLQFSNELQYLRGLLKVLQDLQSGGIKSRVDQTNHSSDERKGQEQPNPYHPLLLHWPEAQASKQSSLSNSLNVDDTIEKLGTIEEGRKEGKTNLKMRLILHEGLAFRFMPYKPAINFAINSLFRIMQGKFVGPSKLFKINPAVYSDSSMLLDNTVYYEASVASHIKSLNDVIYSAGYIEKIDVYSYSAALLTTSILGLTQLQPHNVLVAFDTSRQTDAFYANIQEQSSKGSVEVQSTKIRLQGFNCDEKAVKAIEEFKSPNCNHIKTDNVNVLFFLPQMDEYLHPLIEQYLLEHKFVAEDIMASWIRSLHEQNLRYSLLSQENFQDNDFNTLGLPWLVPTGFISEIYKRLKLIISSIQRAHDEKTGSDSSTGRNVTISPTKKPLSATRPQSYSSLINASIDKSFASISSTVTLHKDILKLFYDDLQSEYENLRLNSDFKEDLDISGVVSYAFIYHQCLLDCGRQKEMPTNITKEANNKKQIFGAVLTRSLIQENSVGFVKPKVLPSKAKPLSKSPSQYYMEKYSFFYEQQRKVRTPNKHVLSKRSDGNEIATPTNAFNDSFWQNLTIVPDISENSPSAFRNNPLNFSSKKGPMVPFTPKRVSFFGDIDDSPNMTPIEKVHEIKSVETQQESMRVVPRRSSLKSPSKFGLPATVSTATIGREQSNFPLSDTIDSVDQQSSLVARKTDNISRDPSLTATYDSRDDYVANVYTKEEKKIMMQESPLRTKLRQQQEKAKGGPVKRRSIADHMAIFEPKVQSVSSIPAINFQDDYKTAESNSLSLRTDNLNEAVDRTLPAVNSAIYKRKEEFMPKSPLLLRTVSKSPRVRTESSVALSSQNDVLLMEDSEKKQEGRPVQSVMSSESEALDLLAFYPEDIVTTTGSMSTSMIDVTITRDLSVNNRARYFLEDGDEEVKFGDIYENKDINLDDIFPLPKSTDSNTNINDKSLTGREKSAKRPSILAIISPFSSAASSPMPPTNLKPGSESSSPMTPMQNSPFIRSSIRKSSKAPLNLVTEEKIVLDNSESEAAMFLKLIDFRAMQRSIDNAQSVELGIRRIGQCLGFIPAMTLNFPSPRQVKLFFSYWCHDRPIEAKAKLHIPLMLRELVLKLSNEEDIGAMKRLSTLRFLTVDHQVKIFFNLANKKSSGSINRLASARAASSFFNPSSQKIEGETKEEAKEGLEEFIPHPDDTEDDGIDINRPELEKSADEVQLEESVLEQNKKLQVSLMKILMSCTNLVQGGKDSTVRSKIALVKLVIQNLCAGERQQSSSMDPMQQMRVLDQFMEIVLDYPGISDIAAEFVRRRGYAQNKMLIHRLLSHSLLDRYEQLCMALAEKHPEMLLMRQSESKLLPCDMARSLPRRVQCKNRLLAFFINLASLPSHRHLVQGGAGLFSRYHEEEELIVRATHFGLAATDRELERGRYALKKRDSSGEGLLLKLIVADIADREEGQGEVFSLFLKALERRVISGEMSKKEAGEFVRGEVDLQRLSPMTKREYNINANTLGRCTLFQTLQQIYLPAQMEFQSPFV